MARDILSLTISRCLEDSALGPGFCDLASQEENLLDRVAEGLKSGREVGPIEFISESDRPGFFFLDGQVRVAKTGSQPGDPVFLNTDIINASDDFDVSTALAVLVHEYGHHYGAVDHQVLDKVGAKVKANALQRGFALDLTQQDGVARSLSVFNEMQFFKYVLMGPVEGKAEVLIWDGYAYFSLASAIEEALCLSAAKPNLGMAWFGNPYLVSHKTKSERAIVVRLNARYICLPNFGIGENRLHDDLVITLPLKVGHASGNTPIDFSKLSLEVIDCRNNPDDLCER